MILRFNTIIVERARAKRRVQKQANCRICIPGLRLLTYQGEEWVK